nr:zinc ribbon domain-containing protein [Methanoculleus marisnigri]
MGYKCREAGKTLLKIGVFEPSSKTCSVCGYRKADLTLKDREWTCPDCGTTHDRDLNAAINIKNVALAGADKRRRACGLAPGGEGDEAGSPLRKLGVVHHRQDSGGNVIATDRPFATGQGRSYTIS